MSEMTLQVESNANAPGVARDHLRSIRSDLEPRFDDVMLLVSELVTNSVRHGQSDDIDLSVRANRGQIRVEVADCGPGIGVLSGSHDGLGFRIVEALADEWGFTGEPKFTVWAEMSKP